jgi:putative transposase
MKRQRYSTDLTDAEWAALEPEIPAPRPGGRPRKTDIREVVNAIF